MDVIVDRCAGLDVHKRTVVACVRTPGTGRRKRDVEVRTFETFSDDLVRLREWLIECQVSEVAMEATGVFWKPVWDVLEGHGFEVLLVNPAHIKNVPGRKTDVNDATWIATLLECGLLRGCIRAARSRSASCVRSPAIDASWSRNVPVRCCACRNCSKMPG